MSGLRANWRLCLLVGLFFLAAALLVVSIALGAAGSDTTRQLSAGKSFSAIYLPALPKISPNGQRVVYVQDAATNGANELWSVSISGDTPVRLSKAMIPGQSAQFAIAPELLRIGAPPLQLVVYLTDQDHLGTPELYSVPIDPEMGGSSTRISRTLVASGHVLDFHLAPASGQAYYRADAVTNNTVELWRVPVAGGPSTRVNRTLPSSNYDVFEYAAASAGGIERVVYRSGRSDVGGYKLWSNRADGQSSQAHEISRSMVTGGGVDATFKITASGTTVLYVADAEDNGEFNLYSVPITGGASVRLNAVVGGVVGFHAGPSGYPSRVTYEQTIEGVTSWWSVPITGGASVAMPPPTVPPVASPDGIWTVYPNGTELWSSRTGALRRVSCAGQVVTSTFLTQPTYSITPDSRTVLYLATGELWASPITGGVCLIFRDGFEDGTTGGWR